MPELSRDLPRPTVYFPAELNETDYTGPLHGRFHPETNIYNVTGYRGGGRETDPELGRIVEPFGGAETGDQELVAWREDGALRFFLDGRPCDQEGYTLHLDVFSRNTGILETDWMADKTAVISGVGSVGSLVALELARAGVGRFLLIDPDVLAYHNLCRHQCGVSDVGRFKIHAVRDRILDVNPEAEVHGLAAILEDTPKTVLDKFLGCETVIAGCADNREGDRYANRLSALYGAPLVSIGFWERAFAGEIFYAIPGETPCYECLFGANGGPEISGRVSANHRFYTTEADLERTRFEPGISADIGFITTVGIKLILDLLNRESPRYRPRLLGELAQFTLICNTSDPEIGGERAEIFAHPLQVTRSLSVEYSETCSVCGAEGR